MAHPFTPALELSSATCGIRTLETLPPVQCVQQADGRGGQAIRATRSRAVSWNGHCMRESPADAPIPWSLGGHRIGNDVLAESEQATKRARRRVVTDEDQKQRACEPPESTMSSRRRRREPIALAHRPESPIS
ncbi:hypothetical protein DFH09DRAFT_1328173 [Mycena vulgaris]|nr:hypothetical protein DFH09DRAFT_1328173 [Mycena vulgaris]